MRNILNLLFDDDDQVIIVQDEDIECLMRKHWNAYREWGLNINFNETKCLTSGTKKDLVLEEKGLKNVSNFKLLGSELQGRNEKEINRRLATTKNAIVALNSVL